ncbi:MAG: type II secretion system F family protein [Planctomycetota bacterium]
MPVFSYTAADADTATVRGTITADTPRAARDQLRGQGLRVRKITPYKNQPQSNSPSGLSAGGANEKSQTTVVRARTGFSIGRWFGAASHRSAWATAVHELAMMLDAGLPILECLDTIAAQHRGNFRAAILQVRDDVAGGRSLAEALGRRPDFFDAASVQMVSVGENSGTLDRVLRELADFKRQQMSVRDRVSTALVYPAFLVVFASAAAVFLMTWVLPPLLESLEETSGALPWPTRMVSGFSNLLTQHAFGLCLGAVVVVCGLAISYRSRRGRYFWHRLLLRLPVLGSMAQKQNVARIAMVIATLSRSGVELTRAFELAEASTGSEPFRKALAIATKRISAGGEVADALTSSGVFPPLAVRVFSVGQESGKLDEMLFRLSEDYDRQVAVLSTRLTALIEPVLILVLATGIGFLLVATVLPILEAGNVMSQ